MTPKIDEFLRSIEAAPLCSRIGMPLNDDDVVQCSGWAEFQNVPLLEYFCDILSDLRNEIAGTIPNDVWYELCPTWQLNLEEIKPRIIAIQKVTASKLPISGETLRWVNVSIMGGIAFACKEIEFQEYTKSTFFRETAKWYLRGHLPCGWSDDFPAGKLVVF